MQDVLDPRRYRAMLADERWPFRARSAKDAATLHVDQASPIIGTAVHHTGYVRDGLEKRMAISREARRFEEDPGTERFLARVPHVLLPNQSRYEVDMNRPPDKAIYDGPEEAWGKEVWDQPLPRLIRERVLERWYEYHRLLDAAVEHAIDRFGRAIVLDMHSYNDRGTDPRSWMGNNRPVVNLGTRFLRLDEDGRQLVDWTLDAFSEHTLDGQPITVGENETFVGGYLCRRLSRTYGPKCITLSIEYKKVFMGPEGQTIDQDALDQLVDQFGELLAGLSEWVDAPLREEPRLPLVCVQASG